MITYTMGINTPRAQVFALLSNILARTDLAMIANPGDIIDDVEITLCD